MIRHGLKRTLRSRPLAQQSVNQHFQQGFIEGFSSRHFSALSSLDSKDASHVAQFTRSSPPPPEDEMVARPSINRLCRPHAFQRTQVRFRRHDRASAFSKPRPKTRKQRQTYNRRMKKIQEKVDLQSPPGSKAGPRRQWIKERKQQLLEAGTETELLDLDTEMEYGYEDALIEDIMGNTAHLTSQPTPEPVYMGNRYTKYFHEVSKKMDQYRSTIDAQSTGESELLDLESIPTLPSDKAISNLLRAYRDANGTRSAPIGIAQALQHLLADIGVPVVAFGEYSFTSLLTCCRTPKEARRIFKLMRDSQHPISAFSWSILVDIHAKMGDFEGCVEVIKEMAAEGVVPTQAAYTSLLAACYKVCSDGRIPHSVRAKAGKVGWDHWQQMRIVGIEADAMAFGAIIRLCAARGQPERAINLLEEMQRFDVKPTTLCFSSALRAVAKSHEIGTRFENGWSQKQLRRESFAAHHGNMARAIVIMAESVEVEIDDGFTSALMLCGAAAGDSATAKAVFLASEVRKMDNLRTIGGQSNLARLEDGSDVTQQGYEATSEWDMESRGLSPSTISDQTLAEAQANSGVSAFGEREYGKDTRAISALLHSCAKAMNRNGVGTMWAGSQNQGYLCENSLRLITTRWEPSYTKKDIGENSTEIGLSQLRRYDEDLRDEEPQPGKRKKFRGLYIDDDAVLTMDDVNDYEEDDEVVEFLEPRSASETDSPQKFGMEMPGHEQKLDITTDAIERPIENSIEDTFDDIFDDNDDGSDMFDAFYAELQEEVRKEGNSPDDLSREEARELFDSMQEEFSNMSDDDLERAMMNNAELGDEAFFQPSEGDNEKNEEVNNVVFEEEDGSVRNNDETLQTTDGARAEDIESQEHASISLDESLDEAALDVRHQIAELEGVSEDDKLKLMQLQEALPGMPINRLRRVLNAYKSTLSYPSLLSLVPILREKMPDHISMGYLRRMNTATADFAFQKAEEDRVVNKELLNSMLLVKTNSGSLNDAVAFHSDMYRKHRVKPTAYSDRLMLQMLVDNNRLTRALAKKQSIEDDGRTIDIPSYGSFIEYYARRKQLGSAMLFLKECIRKHGAAPSQKYLSNLRTLARQLDLEEDLMLNDMIGKDPIEWLKHGERHLKREMTKKGRRNVVLTYNRALA
ncbi:unnamed protein product [Cylindrotheca closterium]|uniref:PROP1-like PPR domain-containing protein n=1 Tax=Cylindrotheca closterium TaxID=2856 RepID=A0AAD2FC99_9STRA|nr:unnamed protein product [Cylindrotheca closterium]